MEDLVKKISQYQLFNFLLSGTVLAGLISKTTSINLIFDNILLGVFVYYFMGLIVSRVGSLVIEPLYKYLHIVQFVPYEKYIVASRSDAKIDTLSQENNTYRTLISMLAVYVFIYAVYMWFGKEILKQTWVVVGCMIVLLVLLSFAYRKQTKYIVSRVNAAPNE